MPDISDTITTAGIDGIQRASVDGRSADGIPLPDLIEADKYVKGVDSVTVGSQKSAWGKVRMARAVPPGAVSHGAADDT